MVRSQADGRGVAAASPGWQTDAATGGKADRELRVEQQFGSAVGEYGGQGSGGLDGHHARTGAEQRAQQRAGGTLDDRFHVTT